MYVHVGNKQNRTITPKFANFKCTCTLYDTYKYMMYSYRYIIFSLCTHMQCTCNKLTIDVNVHVHLLSLSTYHQYTFPESVKTDENSSQADSDTILSPESSGKLVAGCSKLRPNLATKGSTHVANLPDSVTTLALRTLADINLILSLSRPSSLVRGCGVVGGVSVPQFHP